MIFFAIRSFFSLNFFLYLCRRICRYQGHLICFELVLVGYLAVLVNT